MASGDLSSTRYISAVAQDCTIRIAGAGLCLILGAACVSESPHRTHNATSESGDRGEERAVERQVDDPGEGRTRWAPSISIAGPSAQYQTRTIGPALPEASLSRPHTRGKIDIDLNRAPLGDALRFIADSGGFNVVVGDDPNVPVTVKLHNVDAFDALVTVAEAHGLDVEMERGIVLVGVPKKADKP
jgi:hypothetical protein